MRNRLPEDVALEVAHTMVKYGVTIDVAFADVHCNLLGDTASWLNYMVSPCKN